MGGTVGDCIIKDLHYRGFELESEAWPQYDDWIYFWDDLDLPHMTREQAIEAITARCQKQGVTVEPGEVIVTQGGKWIFQGWRLTGPKFPV